MKEEHALILDFLPEGRYTDIQRKPLVQAVGVSYFTLFELVPKENVSFEIMERVFVGRDDPETGKVRDKIELVKRTLQVRELTHNAKSNLDKAIEIVIDENMDKFLGFYNKAGPVSLRLHQLELLPSIGKKHLTSLLRERQKKPFESFEEISERVPLIPNPKRIIVQRVLQEMHGTEKYYLFAKKPSPPRFHGHGGPRHGGGYQGGHRGGNFRGPPRHHQ